MSTEEIIEYYAETTNSDVRADLLLATSLIEINKIAIDCGCGSGSDIASFRKAGFIVHAFDVEDESIKICKERFNDDEHVFLSQDSFGSYEYPTSGLVVADASLFFCPEDEFDIAWKKISQSLCDGGIFCG